MNNKLPYITGGGVLLLLVGFLFSNSQKSTQSQNTNNTVSVSPSISNTNTAASQDPQDIVPGLYKNQIQNTATQVGFVIASTMVENNVDAAGKTVDDHLELTLKNTAGRDLADFEVYYTITDPTTNKKEGYYKKLTGFVLKNGETQQINFDNKQGDGHYGINKNGMYYSSPNKLQFNIQVSTLGYKSQTAQVFKDAGGAEVKD